MKRTALLLLLFAAAACRKSAPTDADFTKLSDGYLTDYYAVNPQTAVALGLHDYDGNVVIPNQANRAAELAMLHRYDSTLAIFDTTQLSADTQMDYQVLTAAIKSDLYKIEELKRYENPMSYGLDVSAYIKRNYAAPDVRLKAVISVLKQAPDFFATAKANVSKNPPRELVDVAIRSTNGFMGYLNADVKTAFADVTDISLLTDFTSARQVATDAMSGYVSYLKNTALPHANGRYAIGPANYRKMLLYNELLTADPDSLLAVGMVQLKKEQAEFAAAARVIDPTKTPIEVFKTIQQEHPTAANLLPDTRQQCERIRQFLIDKQITTVPSDVRATITKTPDYMVGATAAMDPPGPFEAASASEAYYYVTPPKPDWTPKQQQEWLTQFNQYVLEVITIHEAYPGHYVQFLHLNASKASKIRKVFASYAFVEGWAHYTEQMMLEQGFGQTDPKTAAKYKMAQLSESLLRYCRLVSSIQQHTHNWTVDQATKFLQANCYYEEKPAYEEALRGTFDPGYLSYSLGKLQILALRDEAKKQKGAQFSLKAFHDALLDHGMPPISLLRGVVLK